MAISGPAICDHRSTIPAAADEKQGCGGGEEGGAGFGDGLGRADDDSGIGGSAGDENEVAGGVCHSGPAVNVVGLRWSHGLAVALAPVADVGLLAGIQGERVATAPSTKAGFGGQIQIGQFLAGAHLAEAVGPGDALVDELEVRGGSDPVHLHHHEAVRRLGEMEDASHAGPRRESKSRDVRRIVDDRVIQIHRGGGRQGRAHEEPADDKPRDPRSTIHDPGGSEIRTQCGGGRNSHGGCQGFFFLAGRLIGMALGFERVWKPISRFGLAGGAMSWRRASKK